MHDDFFLCIFFRFGKSKLDFLAITHSYKHYSCMRSIHKNELYVYVCVPTEGSPACLATPFEVNSASCPATKARLLKI